MEIIGQPWKCLPWQVTKLIDDKGKKLIQIKKYMEYAPGKFNFKRYGVIYCSEEEWRIFKNKIKAS
jgi:hypothetical protein